MAEFDLSIDFVLAHEGGYVDHPSDPGGATKYGISLRWLRSQKVDIDGDGDIDECDIAKLTRAEARELYRERIWNRARLGEIDSQVIATKVFDMVVNFGPRSGTKRLQQALNAIKASEKRLRVDGRIGPKTLAATNAADPTELLNAIRAAQADHYRYLAEKNPTFEVFLAGWLNRAAS
jgi:lysozyme family protein